MKRSYFIPNRLTIFLIAVFLLPVLALAQEVTPEPGFFAGFPVEDLVKGLITALTLASGWLVTKIPYDKIPAWLIPALTSTVFPWLLSFVAGLATGADIGFWEATMYGTLATFLNQVWTQMKKHGQNAPDKYLAFNGDGTKKPKVGVRA